jgi:hypothetical protein
MRVHITIESQPFGSSSSIKLVAKVLDELALPRIIWQDSWELAAPVEPDEAVVLAHVATILRSASGHARDRVQEASPQPERWLFRTSG